MRYAYPATLIPETDGGFTVTFEGIPGVTYGDTKAEALERAADALVTILSGYVEDGVAIPPPPAAKGRPVVSVTALEAAKLALHDAMVKTSMSNVELGRRLDMDEKAVRRLRDPLYRSHIGTVEAALRVLGRRVDVTIHEVA